MHEQACDLHTVALATSAGIVVVDRCGKLLFANPAAASMLGRDVDDLQGISIGVPLGGPRTVAELDLKRPDGARAVAEMQVGAVRWGTDTVSVVTLRDVSDRVRSTEAVDRTMRRHALSMEGANDGMWDWERDTGRVYSSARMEEMLGYPPQDRSRPTDRWIRRVHPEDQAALLAAIDDHLTGRAPRLDHECRVRRRDGTWLWALVRGIAVVTDGEPERFAGSLTDVSERKSTELELRRMALHDALTGLANRTLFLNHLQGAIERWRRDGRRFAVLFFDLDNFKLVNDALGHAAGDAVLAEVGRRIARCVRLTDAVGRLGGDEFAVVLDRPDDNDTVLATVERIQASLREPVHVGPQILHTSACAGIAFCEDAPMDPDVALRFADIAMYRAKTQGRDRLQVFTATMHAETQRRLALHSRLRAAAERHELFPRYQPIVRLGDGAVVGFEALLRWRMDGNQVLDAAAFIDAAREAGVVASAGWELLRTACHQVRSWRHAGFAVRVAVNLAEAQLARADFASRVLGTLDATGVPGEAVCLELTEQATLGPIHGATEQLDRCHARGVGLMADDVGIGATSLHTLAELPLCGIKIDKSLIDHLDSKEHRHIVQALIALAGILEVDTVAEGVETEAQRDLLVSIGCTMGQGSLFAAALDPDDATRFLERNGRSPGQ